jgi:hypothetical protein
MAIEGRAHSMNPQTIENPGVTRARVGKLERSKILWIQVAVRAKKERVRSKNTGNFAFDLGSIIWTGENAVLYPASDHTEQVVRFIP